ncbi:efflux RND transporter permease subunit [Rhodopirellula sp. MGV]|uniref:efflux RND transporter permease subunit n=1 Tax=Rhodopirellula sp. MGV TaxID=2023130 RepID=UPI000B96EC52|nr:efflux RND transporter permease subunit [Rhodopirellula sp. MGV]OYP32925.1 RND transporter [Rhodopirellula sp. MGV]OYP39206.1 RND transporter [Rhodopirellula sp. MGV]
MWIVELALRRTYTFLVAAILILVFGCVSIWKMPTDIFPEVDLPVVTVVWSYQGMPASDVERRIVLNNERVLSASVNDIEHIESQSLNGVGVIRIFFQPDADIGAAIAQVSATCQTVLKNMPPGINPPFIVRYSATSVPIVQIAVSSDTLTEKELSDYAANFIIQRFGSIPGARVPQPYGGKPKQIMVDLDLNALYARGLSPADISRAVNAQNLIIPAGAAKIAETEFNIRLNSSPELIETFEQIPIETKSGSRIFLGDVATVHSGFQVQTNVVRRDGKRAVLMTVLKGEGASTLEVVRGIREALPRIRAQLPDDLQMDLLFDQSVFVESAIEGVLHEAGIAAGLTALMIFVFLGSLRSTLIVVVSIPLSILASLSMLWMLGETINIMTLGGLALAVGILVDDATVEIENVHRHLQQKVPIRRAILDGAREIAQPAIVSTLAICIVFIPVAFLDGPASYLFVPFAMAVVFALGTSYLLSRTLVPTLMLMLVRQESEHGPSRWPKLARWHQAFESIFNKITANYGEKLDRVLNKPRRWCVLLLGIIVGSLALLPLVGRDFFPSVDAGQFRLHVRAPAGTRIEETEVIFGQVESVIREIVPQDELELVLDNFGLPPFFTTIAYIDNDTVSVSDGEILVSLNPSHAPTNDYVRLLRQELPKRFPQCTFYFMPADIVGQILTFGKPAAVNLQVVGTKREANFELAKKLMQRVRTIPGMVDVRLRQITDAPELKIDVDRALASELELDQRQVADSLLVSLASSVQISPNFWVSPENRVNYRVAVQTPQRRIDDVESLLRTPLFGQDAEQTQLLTNFAGLRRGETEAVISHYNVQPVYEISASVDRRDLAGVATDLHRLIEETQADLPRGSQLALRGQIESMEESFRGLLGGLVFAILLVYLLMVVNFQSWLDPLIILGALPGCLSGIAWSLFVSDTTISVPALMGTIMCIGVSTANSILVVSFANARLADGASTHNAAQEAGQTRLRPVVMTALAMIVGMLPMAIGAGEGGERNAPLGRAVIGGLLLATVYTLVFVPLLFRLLKRSDNQPAA